MTLWKLFHFYESQVTHLWNENINTYFTRFFWGHSETKHQGSWQSRGCLSWCVIYSSSNAWWSKHYVRKQIPGMWLFVCVPIYSCWPFSSVWNMSNCKWASLGWRAATTTKIEGAEANRRPGSIWTPVPESGEGLREAPSSQTVCVSIEMLLF